jgi:hypothetical protein
MLEITLAACLPPRHQSRSSTPQPALTQQREPDHMSDIEWLYWYTDRLPEENDRDGFWLGCAGQEQEPRPAPAGRGSATSAPWRLISSALSADICSTAIARSFRCRSVLPLPQRPSALEPLHVGVERQALERAM